MQLDEPKMLFVDLFCGAGGVTTGIEHAKIFDKKAAKVIACVNHDKNAIVSHKTNHPYCLHFTEDIRTLELTPLIAVSRFARKEYPDAKMYLWASLECTNFSKAKGGLPRDADSRTLAEHLFRYLDAVNFDGIFIENVEEFMAWGPLDVDGKPVSKKRGRDYIKWINNVCDYGYNHDHRILNAADFGAHTSRKRYFGVFMKHGMKIAWPQPTHAKKPDEFNGLKKWNPVKEVLDFDDEGESIFTRKRPLSERTMERVYAGLIKYVAKGDTSFIQKYYSGRPKGKVNSVHEPSPTITTAAGMTLVNTKFITYYYGNAYESSVNQPIGTLTTKDRCNLVQPEFLVQHNNHSTARSLDEPNGSLTQKDKFSLVHAHWIDRPFGEGGGKNSSIDEPVGAVLPVPKLNLVDVEVVKKHTCLFFPQWGMQCFHSIENPSPVLPARMDKMYPYLVQADQTGEPIAIAVFDDDPEIVKKIKLFMAAYGIVDIKMRMLRIKELKLITGFTEDYVLIGTQQEQKKYIGNAVPVKLAQAIIESFAQSLIEPIQKVA